MVLNKIGALWKMHQIYQGGFRRKEWEGDNLKAFVKKVFQVSERKRSGKSFVGSAQSKTNSWAKVKSEPAGNSNQGMA